MRPDDPTRGQPYLDAANRAQAADRRLFNEPYTLGFFRSAS